MPTIRNVPSQGDLQSVLNAAGYGDTIIVNPELRPKAGDIVVALVEDDATVKRFYRNGDTVELRPSNSSMQPMHCADDGRWALKRIGPERARGTYAFRSLLDAGVILAFGSDWNVATLDPLQGVAAAVTRQTTDGQNPDGWVPEQKISVTEAIRAWTVGSATAEFAETYKGRLQRGMLADMVILSTDIFSVPAEQLWRAQVLTTIVGGRVVYERPVKSP